MIQRTQSIFLFLVAVCMVTMLFFPIWEKVDLEKNEIVKISTFTFTHVKVDKETNEKILVKERYTIIISVFALLAAAVAIYSAFRYDNRLFQMKLGTLNSLVMGLGVIGTSLYFIFDAEKVIETQTQGDYLFAFHIGIAGMFFNLLANRFIRKDENLIRSADRIR